MLLAISCSKESRFDCFKGTGKPSTELRTLASFNRIFIKGNIDVVIVQDSIFKAEIHAGENLIGLIRTEVTDTSLNIYNDNRCNWARSYKKGKIIVKVFVPSLRLIKNLGSGLLSNEGTFQADTLEIWAHQTGDAILNVNANVMYTNNHTSADITLTGQTIMLGMYHTGEGYVHCENLSAQYAWSHSKTSGDAYVNASISFSTLIEWEGNIYYKGNPALTRYGSGTGQLLPMQ